MFGTKESTGQIHIQGSLPFIGFNLKDRRGRSDYSGIIDEDVYPAEFSEGPGHEALDSRFVGDVGGGSQSTGTTIGKLS
jgi:hypothetical protein